MFFSIFTNQTTFIKSFYLAFITMLLLVVTARLVQAQSPSPEVPTIHGQKATEPFVGVGVNIPVWKLLGKKKAKALPELPAIDELLILDKTEDIVSQPETVSTRKIAVYNYNPALDYNLSEEITDIYRDSTDITIPRSVATDACTNWYLVTRWSDGSTTEQYMLTSCSEGQLQAEGGDSGTGYINGPDNYESKANICEIAYLAEMGFAGRDPLQAGLSMLFNEGNVKQRIWNRFPNFSDTDSEPLNVVKHAMFVAFNACDFGRFDAENLANLHENCGGIQADRAQSAAMDIFNNGAGLTIQAQVGCNNINDLAQAIFNAFLSGQLRKIDGQPTP